MAVVSPTCSAGSNQFQRHAASEYYLPDTSISLRARARGGRDRGRPYKPRGSTAAPRSLTRARVARRRREPMLRRARTDRPRSVWFDIPRLARDVTLSACVFGAGVSVGRGPIHLQPYRRARSRAGAADGHLRGPPGHAALDNTKVGKSSNSRMPRSAGAKVAIVIRRDATRRERHIGAARSRQLHATEKIRRSSARGVIARQAHGRAGDDRAKERGRRGRCIRRIWRQTRWRWAASSAIAGWAKKFRDKMTRKAVE